MARRETLSNYLGSSHSALGVSLFAFGCIALVGALVAAGTEPSNLGERGFWIVVAYGLAAIPLGLSMRRKEPPFANLILGCVLLALPIAWSM